MRSKGGKKWEKNKTLHNKERRQLMCFVLLGFFFLKVLEFLGIVFLESFRIGRGAT